MKLSWEPGSVDRVVVVQVVDVGASAEVDREQTETVMSEDDHKLEF